MRACDKKLKSCLIEMMEQEEDRLREELLHENPHVFSVQFDRAMDEAMQVHKSRSKIRSIAQYVAAAIAVILLTGGILLIGSDDLCASNIGVDILEWLDEFFTVENKNSVINKSDIVFDESQIGYLPEGFEKAGENLQVAYVKYWYENSEGNTIWITVYKSNLGGQHDNENIENDIHLSEKGFEYSIIHKPENNVIAIIWQDDTDIYYKLESNILEIELIKIMNSISY